MNWKKATAALPERLLIALHEYQDALDDYLAQQADAPDWRLWAEVQALAEEVVSERAFTEAQLGRRPLPPPGRAWREMERWLHVAEARSGRRGTLGIDSEHPDGGRQSIRADVDATLSAALAEYERLRHLVLPLTEPVAGCWAEFKRMLGEERLLFETACDGSGNEATCALRAHLEYIGKGGDVDSWHDGPPTFSRPYIDGREPLGSLLEQAGEEFERACQTIAQLRLQLGELQRERAAGTGPGAPNLLPASVAEDARALVEEARAAGGMTPARGGALLEMLERVLDATDASTGAPLPRSKTREYEREKARRYRERVKLRGADEGDESGGNGAPRRR